MLSEAPYRAPPAVFIERVTAVRWVVSSRSEIIMTVSMYQIKHYITFHLTTGMRKCWSASPWIRQICTSE